MNNRDASQETTRMAVIQNALSAGAATDKPIREVHVFRNTLSWVHVQGTLRPSSKPHPVPCCVRGIWCRALMSSGDYRWTSAPFGARESGVRRPIHRDGTGRPYFPGRDGAV